MQRELRLGDILDDYCPRERRVTNHAVVAMVGQTVKQTRCTTCEAEHEYKHAKVPRQRRKSEPAALYSQVAAGAPKRVTHEAAPEPESAAPGTVFDTSEAKNEPVSSPDVVESVPLESATEATPATMTATGDTEQENGEPQDSEGPVHRPLIRATLPRPEGQMPPARPAPEFTIRQPGGRPGRFRFRPQRGHGVGFQGNRSNGNTMGNQSRGPRQGGRPPQGSMSRMARRHDSGRKRSK